MARHDDDALSWGGDDDPTLDASAPSTSPLVAPEAAVPDAPEPLPSGFSAVGRGSDGAGHVAVPEPAASTPEKNAPMGNATLVSLGVIGGVYLLFALGWLIGGTRLQGMAQFLVTDVVFQISLWLAVCAPLIWFGAVLVVTQGRSAWLRFAWLAAGLILLVPWPFIAVGAMGTVTS